MAKVVVVTEFPGKTDLATGRLLSGATGKIFWELAQETGLTQHDISVKSVISSRPGSGKIEDFCVNKKEAEMLASAYHYSSYPRTFIKTGKYLHPRYLGEVDSLIESIKEEKPNLVVCLGSFATWALLGSAKLTALRGTAAESPFIEGLKVIPTYHPVTIMRDWSQRVIAGADLMKATREATFPEIIRPKRVVKVPETKEDIDSIEKILFAQRRLSLDIETKLGQITCVGFGVSPSLSFCIPITDSRKPDWNYWSYPDEIHAIKMIKRICENPLIKKDLQNGVYDIQYLWHVWNIKTMGFNDDSMIMSHSLYSELPKSLGFLGSVYTNEASWKLMRKFEEKEVK